MGALGLSVRARVWEMGVPDVKHFVRRGFAVSSLRYAASRGFKGFLAAGELILCSDDDEYR